MRTPSRFLHTTVPLAAVLLLLHGTALHAQSVRGSLRENRSERPIAGGTIELLTDRGAATNISTTTDAAGHFLVHAQRAGMYRLRASAAGFRTALSPGVELRAGEEVGLTLYLTADSIQLAPVKMNPDPPGPGPRGGARPGFAPRGEPPREGPPPAAPPRAMPPPAAPPQPALPREAPPQAAPPREAPPQAAPPREVPPPSAPPREAPPPPVAPREAPPQAAPPREVPPPNRPREFPPQEIAPRGVPPRAVGGFGGFNERRERNLPGRFITRPEIERFRPRRASEIFEGIPGLFLVPAVGGFGNRIRTEAGCEPAVFVDGVRVSLVGETIDEIVNPADIEGIEIYTNPAEIPPEFGFFDECGAIFIWTDNAY